MAASIGYARVSSADQSTDTQVDRLKAAGCSVIREEKVSGRSRDGRAELATVLEFIQPGDTLTVVKLDRFDGKVSSATSAAGSGGASP